MSESSRSSSSSHTTTNPNVDESIIDEDTEESEIDEEEQARALEKAAACKFAIEQFYDGFWSYRSQREARYVKQSPLICLWRLESSLLDLLATG